MRTHTTVPDYSTQTCGFEECVQRRNAGVERLCGKVDGCLDRSALMRGLFVNIKFLMVINRKI